MYRQLRYVFRPGDAGGRGFPSRPQRVPFWITQRFSPRKAVSVPALVTAAAPAFAAISAALSARFMGLPQGADGEGHHDGQNRYYDSISENTGHRCALLSDYFAAAAATEVRWRVSFSAL